MKKYSILLAILIIAVVLLVNVPVLGKTISFDPPTGNKTVMELINGILTWAIRIAIPVATLIIIFAGTLLLTAQGNQKRIDQGKKMLTWAIIGLAVILVGKGFITLIRSIIDLAK